MMKLVILLILASAIVLSCCVGETFTLKTGPFAIKVTGDQSVNFPGKLTTASGQLQSLQY
jgi:hypothetical protein